MGCKPVWKYEVPLVCRGDCVDVLGSLPFLLGWLGYNFSPWHRRFKRKQFVNCANGGRSSGVVLLCAKGFLSPVCSRAFGGGSSCRVTFLSAAACSGIQSLNSWNRHPVLLDRDLSGGGGFAVLDDQISSSLKQRLAVLGKTYLDLPRLSFFSSEPQNFSSSFLCGTDCTAWRTLQSLFCL